MLHQRKRPVSRKVHLKNFTLTDPAIHKYSQIIYNNGETEFVLFSTTYHAFAHSAYYMLCKMYGGNNLKFESPIEIKFNYDLQKYRQPDGSYRFPKKNTIYDNTIKDTNIDMLQVIELYSNLVKVDSDYIFYFDENKKEYVIDLVANKK